ncbi:MAG: MerR family transcriptional regulator [Burkholderiales bacterium]|nr:MerR family transcriptional regulator [Burkholderiales bacterium]
MYIGELAKLTGASPKAIRHYESLGLLGAVQRSGAYRVYADRDVLLLRLIRQAQVLGFKLSELHFLKSSQSQPDWQQLKRLLASKRLSIAVEIKHLEQLDGQLEALSLEISACPEIQASLADCIA